jgi:SAM-dependent methyltransferase
MVGAAQLGGAQQLGDVRGLDVVEFGCGTAYFSAWLAGRGARPTGVDVTPPSFSRPGAARSEGGVQFHPGHGDRITILRASSFAIDDVREICAPPGAVDHPCYQLAAVEWARRGPLRKYGSPTLLSDAAKPSRQRRQPCRPRRLRLPA